MPGLIAVRKNISPGAIFWQQSNNYVFYSLDNVFWYPAFMLPDGVGGVSSGGNSYYFNNQKVIETYTKKYYQETNIYDLLIKLLEIPTTRTEFLENAEKAESGMPSKRAICQASYALVLGLRQTITDYRNGTLSEDPAVQTAQTAGGIVGTIGALAGLIIGFTPIGIALIAGGIATSFASNTLLPAALESAPDLTDEQVESIACCLYEAMKSGNTDYADFASAGCDLPSFSWADFATPEIYAGYLAMIQNGPGTGDCPCETCIEAVPADCVVNRGDVRSQSLITTNFNTGGSVFEMQAQCVFQIPLMTISSITVTTQCRSYENVAVNNPQINLSAPSTGGGNTPIPEGNGITLLNPAHYPLVPVDNFTLTLRVGVCSACTTAQTSAYLAGAFGSIIRVEVCGLLE